MNPLLQGNLNYSESLSTSCQASCDQKAFVLPIQAVFTPNRVSRRYFIIIIIIRLAKEIIKSRVLHRGTLPSRSPLMSGLWETNVKVNKNSIFS